MNRCIENISNNASFYETKAKRKNKRNSNKIKPIFDRKRKTISVRFIFIPKHSALVRCVFRMNWIGNTYKNLKFQTESQWQKNMKYSQSTTANTFSCQMVDGARTCAAKWVGRTTNNDDTEHNVFIMVIISNSINTWVNLMKWLLLFSSSNHSGFDTWSDRFDATVL